VLVRVRATSVNRSDWEALIARPVYVRLSGAGFLRPKHTILGSDVAGRVETVGKDVTEFQPGDDVFGDTLYSGAGGFAEYVSVPERAPLVLKPPGLTFEEAAAIPQGGMLALQSLRHTDQVHPGQRVLINGAGGGAGSFAVQIAKSQGADVTGVDSAAKLEMMRSIGADHVIDYQQEDFAEGRQRYDRILDFVGSRSIIAFRRALGPEGIYVQAGGSIPSLLQTVALGTIITKTGSRTMRLLLARPNKEDLSYLARLVEEGTVTPFIGRRYEFDEVPVALGALGTGSVSGKAVIAI